MKKLLSLFLFLAICLTTFTGCWDQKIYERVGFILVAGLESGKNRDLLITYIIPVVGGEKKLSTEMLAVQAYSLRDSRLTTDRTASKILLAGKLQVIHFSEELAEKGIHDILNVVSRDPINPLLAHLDIVDGSPYNLIKAQMTFTNIQEPEKYAVELLNTNAELSYIIDTNVHNFEKEYFAPGLDPVLPILKIRNNGIEILGSALFSGDKMVGKIGIRETQLLIAMKNKVKSAQAYSFYNLTNNHTHKEGSRSLSAALTLKKRKIKIKIKNNKPVVNISLIFSASISDYKWTNIDMNTKKVLENDMSKDLKASADEFLKYTKKVGSDPIGIGEMVRSKYNSYWKSVDWTTAYKNAEINFEDQVNITDIGSLK